MYRVTKPYLEDEKENEKKVQGTLRSKFVCHHHHHHHRRRCCGCCGCLLFLLLLLLLLFPSSHGERASLAHLALPCGDCLDRGWFVVIAVGHQRHGLAILLRKGAPF